VLLVVDVTFEGLHRLSVERPGRDAVKGGGIAEVM